MNKIETFDALRVARDGYKTKFDELSKKHTAMIAEIKSNYRGKLLQEQLAAETKRYNDDLEKARREARTFAHDAAEQLRTDEITKASRLPDARIQILRSLADIPMTRHELDALRSKFNNDFWTSKMFSYMAAKNGIEEKIEPTLDDKLKILDEAETAISSYFTNYNGTDTSYTTLSSVSDQRLDGWERSYTNNYDGITLTAQQKAERVADMVLGESDVSAAGIRLKNLMTNMTDWEQTLFFEAFSNKGGNSDIIAWCGATADYKDFLSSTAGSLKQARQFVNTVTEYTDKTDAAAFLDNTPADNRSFVANVLTEIVQTTRNPVLLEACQLSSVPEFQQLAEPQRIANN